LQNIRLVGLTHVKKLLCGLNGIVSQLTEPPPHFHHLLRCKRLIKGDANTILYSKTLLFGFCLGLFALFSENLSVEVEFSSENHVLLDESTLLTSAKRSSADFFTRVAHRWVRPKTSLTRPACGGTYTSSRLAESWIVLESHLLQLLQRDSRRLW
jgi:hypothetical protein